MAALPSPDIVREFVISPDVVPIPVGQGVGDGEYDRFWIFFHEPLDAEPLIEDYDVDLDEAFADVTLDEDDENEDHDDERDS